MNKKGIVTTEITENTETHENAQNRICGETASVLSVISVV